MKKPRNKKVRGSDMYTLGKSLQKSLQLAEERIREAEELIKDLAAHDGAEGFSASTYEAMEAYGNKWGLS